MLQATNEHSRDIVSKFLNADPTQRLGNLAGGLDEAKKHPYFTPIDWNGLAHKRMPVSDKATTRHRKYFGSDHAYYCGTPFVPSFFVV